MTEEIEQDEFVLRPYQSEILDIAINENTIIYLPTGAGKTYIAVMLINRLSHSLVEPINKISVVLVNTVPLVEQHCATIKRHTDFEVGQFSGDQNVDYWTRDQWNTQLGKHQVIVLTAQIFLDVLRHGYFTLEKVNLIIFDECHQAVNDQPMRQIMQLFQNINECDQPRVLGLTATLLNGNCTPGRVREEVRSLEKTFHGTVATVRKLAQVIGFSTNPQERILHFKSNDRTDDVINQSLAMLINLREFISGIKFNSSVKTSPKKLLNHENESKPLTRVLNQLILHIEMFGIYGGSKATLACLIQIERLKRQAEDSCFERIFSVMATTLSCVQKLLDDAMAGYGNAAQIMLFSTSQILSLIELLRTYKDKGDTFCGIVFVKQRFTAKVLYYVIKALSECDSEFGFIRTEFMVGFNAGSGDRDTREAFFSAKINKKIVNSFRNNEINLLIASSVVEEGIDIPRCTLVVKFDRPMDYRSYIQSKGRARHGDSFYYIMVPIEEKDKYLKSYNNFQQVEKLLQEFLVGKTDEREAPSQSEIRRELYEDHDVPPYFVDGPDSPHVAAVSAISLLNRYCQSLCRDKYAPNAPSWYIDTKIVQYKTKYAVTIELPIICPLRDPIQGPFMYTKTAAKRAAALEVCKILHKEGELTNRLLPRTEAEDELDFEYLFEHWIKELDTDEYDEETKKFKPKPGTKKFIRQYNVAIPRILKNPKSDIYYLHPIVMKCDRTWEKLSELLIQTQLNYALLTKSPLPSLSPFPIFVTAGQLKINILENYNSIKLTEDEMYDLKKFNNFLFMDLLRVLKDFLMYDNDKDSGFMIVVPVTNLIDPCLMTDCKDMEVDSIELDYTALQFQINLDLARQNTSIEEVDEPSKQSKINLKVTDESHLGKVVCPWYRVSDPYIVIGVCTSKNALSEWPNNNYPTYESYYKDKYGHAVYNPTQPLLEVKGISKRLNCIQPRSISIHTGSKRTKQVMQEGFEEHLIPEMCVLQKYPGTLWYKAHCLPTIIHRVLCLLQAEELRRKITEETGIGIVEHAKYKRFNCIPVDSRVLNNEEKKIQPVQQRNVTEVDAAAIMPSSNQTPSKRLTNKDYAAKMLEKQYHWKDEDEPVDIDRNIDSITLFQIHDYDHFVTEKYSYDDMEKIANSPKASKYPAITLEKQYEERPIEMISKTQTGLGPEQWVIFQCLTASNANEIVNLERLETLGDSLLKLTATLFLFLKYPQCSEGRLTNIKGKMIGNKNLLYCGMKKNLGGYIKVFDFSPKTDWLPPSYCVPKLLRDKIDNKQLSPNKLFEFGVPLEEQLNGELAEDTIEEFSEIVADVNKEEPVTNEPITSMNKFLGCQNVQDKTVSDCVEALIGAYLKSNGLVGGLALIGWFNIIPNNLNPKELFFHTPPSPLIYPTITNQEIDFHIPNYTKLEEHLGYKFRNRAFLLQALTHASYSINRLTDCYQRLEFLGDAVLDFLITSHIYEISDNLTPGELTDLRSALVNNVTFAVLVVRNGFHKHLKFINTKLMDAFDMFVQFQEERDFTINEEALILVEEDPMYIAEHVHVPKVLGDLFESLAGAVFLDSGMDLQTTWRVFHRLMWREIETFRWNVPKSPVRMLYEYVSAAPRFEKAKVIDNKVTVVSCSVMVNGKKQVVHGFGENKTQAKRAAAKLALRLLSCD